MLSVERLNQYYGQSHTLRDVDLEAPEGLCTCVMGRNGVGKTTLLRSILGLTPTRSGAVRFKGEDIRPLAAERRSMLGIGYVPQGRQIFPRLTVEENLRIGLTARRGGDRIPKLVEQLFPVLGEMRGRRGGDLSGGQQQQLAIGRALAIEPSLLILDEPTEGIQPNVVSQIADIIHLLKDQGMTVLLVEQKLPFVRRLADRFAILDRGSAVAAGSIDELDDGLVREYLTV
jgi:urea transport system ATP-binding protein